MGDEAGSNHTAGVAARKAALLARSSIWKSAIVIAPLAATALFIASGTQAQTSGSTALPTQPTDATTVAPKPAPVAARKRRGPKEKTKELVGRAASPVTTTDPATPAQTGTPVAPIDAPDAARRGGPKGGGRDKILVGRTEAPAPDSTPVEGRRKEGPKGDGESGRTEAPAPDTQPAVRRKEGPKGDGDHGRTATTPAPDAQPAGRGAKPKGAGSHGRTATTPLLIGALSAAAILALVVSGGNDRPASP